MEASELQEYFHRTRDLDLAPTVEFQVNTFISLFSVELMKRVMKIK